PGGRAGWTAALGGPAPYARAQPIDPPRGRMAHRGRRRRGRGARDGRVKLCSAAYLVFSGRLGYAGRMAELVDLRREGAVFVLTMRGGENRFNEKSVAALDQALDRVEASEGSAALVTTGEEKFYSNGLDLDWMSSEGQGRGADFLASVLKLLGRFL